MSGAASTLASTAPSTVAGPTASTEASTEASTAPLLELTDITVYRGDTRVFDRLSLTLPAKLHTAVLGPNGAGKSTLLQLVNRELYPVDREGARLRLFGRDRWDVSELRRSLGIVSPELQLRHLRSVRVRDVAVSGFFASVGVPMHRAPSERQWNAADEALERVGVAALAGRPFNELSTGEQRRVLLARALVHQPRTLLLDEPTANLDLAASIRLLRTLRELARDGVQLVIVTHQLEDLLPELEHVVLLRSGTVFAQGAPAEVLTAGALTALYGVELQVVEEAGFRRALPA